MDSTLLKSEDLASIVLGSANSFITEKDQYYESKDGLEKYVMNSFNDDFSEKQHVCDTNLNLKFNTVEIYIDNVHFGTPEIIAVESFLKSKMGNVIHIFVCTKYYDDSLIAFFKKSTHNFLLTNGYAIVEADYKREYDYFSKLIRVNQ